MQRKKNHSGIIFYGPLTQQIRFFALAWTRPFRQPWNLKQLCRARIVSAISYRALLLAPNTFLQCGLLVEPIERVRKARESERAKRHQPLTSAICLDDVFVCMRCQQTVLILYPRLDHCAVKPVLPGPGYDESARRHLTPSGKMRNSRETICTGPRHEINAPYHSMHLVQEGMRRGRTQIGIVDGIDMLIPFISA